MSPAKYTPEPWKAEVFALYAFRNGQRVMLAQLGVSADRVIPIEENEANAIRMAQCVNACAPNGPATLALRAVAECDLVAFPSDLRLAARAALRALGS